MLDKLYDKAERYFPQIMITLVGIYGVLIVTFVIAVFRILSNLSVFHASVR